MDFPIVFYDLSGISFQNQLQSRVEKDKILYQLFPKRILSDYANNMIKDQPNIIELKNRLSILQKDLKVIRESKFYRVWQTYNQFLRKIGIKRNNKNNH